MSIDSPPICLLPGVEKNYPIYCRISPSLRNARHVEYPSVERGERLGEFAARVADSLPQASILVGTSFGGVLAQQIASILPTRACILISSIRGPHQLPFFYRLGRLVGHAGTMRVLGAASGLGSTLPSRFHHRWRASVGRLSLWHHWAMASLCTWNPPAPAMLPPICQIHGTCDTTFPIRHIDADVVVQGGRHALPVSHPQEVLQAIHCYVQQLDSG
ncbi:alpha/beta fold hydrolase [Aeoliella mucimassa]|uniref:AB hydrolase-1 domain-containing protein n=1 Tax=Aeoliella mucimassa TaxID=2527972 RepID=A0A518AM97_9BACT|nr:alpha/beta hydrolase [Aeoliella mucimassa]QDU55841.1 hypothetical protein Pan181_20380 [Aeoliella mucimassa]